MNNRIETITEPVDTVITVDDAKLFMRIFEDEDDTLIETLINAVTKFTEDYTRRCFVEQTLIMYMDRFPRCFFYLPRTPLVSIIDIKYLDSTGTQQTLANTVYGADRGKSIPARVYLKNGQSWPTVFNQLDSISVEFKCGEAVNGENVNEQRRHLVKLLVNHFYENREPVVVGASVATMPTLLQSLLSMNTIWEATE